MDQISITFAGHVVLGLILLVESVRNVQYIRVSQDLDKRTVIVFQGLMSMIQIIFDVIMKYGE